MGHWDMSVSTGGMGALQKPAGVGGAQHRARHRSPGPGEEAVCLWGRRRVAELEGPSAERHPESRIYIYVPVSALRPLKLGNHEEGRSPPPESNWAGDLPWATRPESNRAGDLHWAMKRPHHPAQEQRVHLITWVSRRWVPSYYTGFQAVDCFVFGY